MPVPDEPIHYEKTALSDLQGAWENLRDSVVEHHEDVFAAIAEGDIR
jgi:hypothetical protein